jgi:hypothetical protein
MKRVSIIVSRDGAIKPVEIPDDVEVVISFPATGDEERWGHSDAKPVAGFPRSTAKVARIGTASSATKNT